MKAIRWEYKTYCLPYGVGRKQVENLLNSLGYSGWELTAIRRLTSQAAKEQGYESMMILKRPNGFADGYPDRPLAPQQLDLLELQE